MAIISFSVPDEVKAAFNAAFAGRNKSAMAAAWMRSAVADEGLAARRRKLLEELIADRPARRPATDAEIAAARRAGRP